MPRKKIQTIDQESLEIFEERNRLLKKKRKKRIKSIVPSLFKKKETELTEDEIQFRKEAIRDFLPKLDINSGKRKVDLKTDHEECERITKSACFRPDVYLDYGCFNCSLYKHCKCGIKLRIKK